MFRGEASRMGREISLEGLAANFRRQNSELALGSAGAQVGHRCQKQPLMGHREPKPQEPHVRSSRQGRVDAISSGAFMPEGSSERDLAR